MSKTKALNPEWKNNLSVLLKTVFFQLPLIFHCINFALEHYLISTVSINFQVSSLQGEQGYPGGHRIDWKDAGHPGNSWEIIAIHFQIFVILCR